MNIKSITKQLLLLSVVALTPLASMGVTAGSAVSETAQVQQQINVNSASVESLQGLKGIGHAKAKAIVDHRQKFGAFKKSRDLLAVDGIGEAILGKIQAQLRF